jgi:hypothetical protein
MKHLKKFESYSINEELGVFAAMGALALTGLVALGSEFAFDYNSLQKYKSEFGKYETGEIKEVTTTDGVKLNFKVIDKDGMIFYSTKIEDINKDFSPTKMEIEKKIFVLSDAKFSEFEKNPVISSIKSLSSDDFTPPQFRRYPSK